MRPTCDDAIVRRLAWNAPPRDRGTVRSPYQLNSTILASTPATCSASSSPSGVPLAWITRSASTAAAGGSANRTPSARATAARRGLMSISSTSHPGIRDTSQAARQPTVPAPITAIRSPRCGLASHTPLSAVSRLAASTTRARIDAVGQHVDVARRNDEARLMRMKNKDDAAGERVGAVLDAPDHRIAVLHRRREVALPGRARASGPIRSAARGRRTPAPRFHG